MNTQESSTSISELLDSLLQSDIQLHEDSGQLCFSAPLDVVTNEIKEKIKIHKADILSYLKRQEELAQTPLSHGALDDMQKAYWVGENNALELSLRSNYYFDADFSELNTQRLSFAWNTLIQRHDMLRSTVSAEGKRKVLNVVDDY